MKTTLDVVERFAGELDLALVDQLAREPEEHLAEFAVRLHESWLAWQDQRTASSVEPASHYLLSETRSEVEPLPLHKCLQLALSSL